MALVLLLILVESLSTTVLSEEVETLPTTYPPAHKHMTFPSTGRRMLGVFSFVEDGLKSGLNKFRAAVQENGGEYAMRGKDAADAAEAAKNVSENNNND